MSHRSRMCALLMDCPEDRIEAAIQFWSAALGRSIIAKTNPTSSYTGLETPAGSPIDIFLQAMSSPESRLHVDIETDNVEAEIARLEQLGARLRQRVESWWVMEAPSGHVFCVVPVQSVTWPVGAVEWSD